MFGHSVLGNSALLSNRWVRDTILKWLGGFRPLGRSTHMTDHVETDIHVPAVLQLLGLLTFVRVEPTLTLRCFHLVVVNQWVNGNRGLLHVLRLRIRAGSARRLHHGLVLSDLLNVSFVWLLDSLTQLEVVVHDLDFAELLVARVSIGDFKSLQTRDGLEEVLVVRDADAPAWN